MFIKKVTISGMLVIDLIAGYSPPSNLLAVDILLFPATFSQILELVTLTVFLYWEKWIYQAQRPVGALHYNIVPVWKKDGDAVCAKFIQFF